MKLPGAIWRKHLVLHTYFCQHLLPLCCLRRVWMSLNQVEELLSELLELLLLLPHITLKRLREKKQITESLNPVAGNTSVL